MKYPVKDELKKQIVARLGDYGSDIIDYIRELERGNGGLLEKIERSTRRTTDSILLDIELYERRESEQDG